jgi:superfamily II DNA or RNA helicase
MDAAPISVVPPTTVGAASTGRAGHHPHNRPPYRAVRSDLQLVKALLERVKNQRDTAVVTAEDAGAPAMGDVIPVYMNQRDSILSATPPSDSSPDMTPATTSFISVINSRPGRSGSGHSSRYVKHTGAGPRPALYWNIGSMALVDCSKDADASEHQYSTIDPDPSADPPDAASRLSWKQNGRREVACSGLMKRGFAPESSVTASYHETYKHGNNSGGMPARLTQFQLGNDPYYLLIVHENLSNNQKKRTRESSDSDSSDADEINRQFKATMRKLNKWIQQGKLNQAQMTEVGQLAAAGTQQQQLTTHRSGTDTARGGIDSRLDAGSASMLDHNGVEYRGEAAKAAPSGADAMDTSSSSSLPSQPQPAGGSLADIVHRMEQLAEQIEPSPGLEILVCVNHRGCPAATDEVDHLIDTFGYSHVHVVQTSRPALERVLFGNVCFDIVHFIGHGDTGGGDAFCMAAAPSSQADTRVELRLHTESLCELLRTYNLEHNRCLQCVFFNVCVSDQQGQLLRSFDMSDGGVGSVLCVPGVIADKEIAVPFSREFYNALVREWRSCQPQQLSADDWALCCWFAHDHAQNFIRTDPKLSGIPSAHPLLLSQPTVTVAGTPIEQQSKATGDRGYQQWLIEIAKRKNSIIVARTGAGKTRIALRMAQTALRRFPDRLVVFTAPTGSLTQQQMEVFMRELFTGCGDDGVAAALRVGGHFAGKRRGEPNPNVMFFTPATLVQDLHSGSLSINRMSLLVVDECHHTRGNSPMTKLAEMYEQCRDVHRPRFLGLTALPGTAADVPKDGLERLCGTWGAHIVTVPPGSELAYEMAQDVPVPRITPLLMERDAAARLDQQLEALAAGGMNPNHDEYERAQIDAKQPLLFEHLRSEYDADPEGFRAIVFVHNRNSAMYVVDAIRSDPELRSRHIRTDCLIGRQGEGKMTAAKQHKVLDRFRVGGGSASQPGLNLLVATSVAEEGLDVPQCRLVLRLDAMVTEIGFVSIWCHSHAPRAL